MTFDPLAARQFAVEVVATLRAAGHEALWAGGCVRDFLLGKVPKDFDVATSATPDEVRRVFGKRRTLGVGAAFGVMVVLGPKEAGQIEVATFRQDAQYSDGRRPDGVTFSTAEHDAQRRDFTINGLFYDPLAERVIDYVGGQEDLRRGMVRAIGDPHERISEDKLRMLRAVRFTATFGFALDAATLRAVQQTAESVVIVSAERIAAELRRMLVHANRVQALDLLRESELLPFVLPESERVTKFVTDEQDHPWRLTRELLENLHEPTFSVALAALLFFICERGEDLETAETICRRWKLANHETEGVRYLLANYPTIVAAHEIRWPVLQRVLITERIAELLDFSAALSRVLHGHTLGADHAHDRLKLPPDQLNPPPLISGDDLKQAGIRPGPAFRLMLDAVRDAQLEGRVQTKDAALEFLRGADF